MSSGDLSGIMALIIMALFLGIWAWAWSKKRQASFKKTANLPLEEDQPELNGIDKGQQS